jgi:8-oxo-dGTP pyrophosphatase MutT (NUDIX family)
MTVETVRGEQEALGDVLAGRARVVLPDVGCTRAAVLVPLLAVEGRPHLLYTRRANDLPHHRGQVAFPGGRHHPLEDTDLTRTALREAHEEIGLEPTEVQLLGLLDDIETVATRFVITPVVGIVPHPYAWRPCPAEVDAIFTVPLSFLRAPGAERQERWDFGGRELPIATYRVGDNVIWGATQRITRNLLGLLGGGG